MLEDLIKDRLEKLKNLREAGVEPYPTKAQRTHLISELLVDFQKLSKSKKKIFAVGRVIGWRAQGGIAFADLMDESGKIQAVIAKSNLGQFNLFKDNLDIGDFVECGGFLFKTKKGERSIDVRNIKLLTKSLRPLPDQWYGLKDIETKLRSRYLDILFNPEVREIFLKKALFWKIIRQFLEEKNFVEVETPVLEAVPGGADAEPFVTHHNALDNDFYLRISPELALKKLLVGGFEKIFEIGRIFRNEGIDAEHLQDYTQCEFYWAYNDYKDLMKMIERLYKQVVKGVTGGLKTKWQGKIINWGGKWPAVEYCDLFKKYTGLDLEKATEKQLLAQIKKHKLEFNKGASRGRLIDVLFKKLARPHLIQPMFLINPPAAIEPLAKRLDGESWKVARLQVVACGTELGKGFSEANDPVDQRERFEEQMRMRKGGDKEAQRLDEEFLTALEYGMPPAAGFGLSERLFAVLMDKPVRETVIFPLMKPKS